MVNAKALVKRYDNRSGHSPILEIKYNTDLLYSPFEYKRKPTQTTANIGSLKPPVVIADFSCVNNINHSIISTVGYNYSEQLDNWSLTDQACDYIYLGEGSFDFKIPGTLGVINDLQTWKKNKDKPQHYPLFCGFEYIDAPYRSTKLNFIAVDDTIIFNLKNDSRGNFLSVIKNDPTVVLVIETNNQHGMADQRRLLIACKPLILLT